MQVCSCLIVYMSFLTNLLCECEKQIVGDILFLMNSVDSNKTLFLYCMFLQLSLGCN